MNLLTELDEDKVVVCGDSLEVILGEYKHSTLLLDLIGGQGSDHEK